MRKPKRSKMKWTTKELDYLEKWFGKKTNEVIAKTLRRSIIAISCKAKELGYGHKRDYDGKIPICTLGMALNGGVKPSSFLIQKMRKFNIPRTRILLGRAGQNELVDIDEFWEWLRINQESFSLAKLEPNILGVEPEWAKEKRKKEWLEIAERRWRA